MNVKMYCRLFREQSGYLYRIAYFYLGEEKPALRAVRKTACEGYRKVKKTEGGENFKLQMIRVLLKGSTINQNPNRYLTALYLRHMQKMKLPEIAYAMDIPEGSVKAYLDRAKANMRQDTAGIGNEVRRVTAIQIPETLWKAEEEGFQLLQQQERRASQKKLLKRCFLGVALGILATMIGLGIYSGIERGMEQSQNQEILDEQETNLSDPL